MAAIPKLPDPHPPAPVDAPPAERRHLPPLSLPTRVGLHVAGWILIVAGIAMLALPGQGILTILLGLAVLSLASIHVHRWLEARFERWPKAWGYIERFRHAIHRRLHRE
jgi:putative transmembrane protein PGPGW